MYGREARDVTVIAPLLDGVVADLKETKGDVGAFCAQGAQRYFPFQPARDHECLIRYPRKLSRERYSLPLNKPALAAFA